MLIIIDNYSIMYVKVSTSAGTLAMRAPTLSECAIRLLESLPHFFQPAV